MYFEIDNFVVIWRYRKLLHVSKRSILTIVFLLVSDLGGKLTRSYSHQLLLTKVRRADKNLINENHAIEILLQMNDNQLVIMFIK